MLRKWKRLSWLTGLLLLSLPLTMPLSYRLYRTAIVIPRFESQQAQIMAAIDSYRGEQGTLPGSLSQLVPAYLPAGSLKFDRWPFTYRPEEGGAYHLQSHFPSRWGKGAALRICHVAPGEPALCTYHYLCGYRMATYLSGAVADATFRQVWWPFWQRPDHCEAPLPGDGLR